MTAPHIRGHEMVVGHYRPEFASVYLFFSIQSADQARQDEKR